MMSKLLFSFPGVVEILRDDPGYILAMFKKRRKPQRPGMPVNDTPVRKQYYCATLDQAFALYVDRKPDPEKPSVKSAKELLVAITQAVEDVRKMAAAICPIMQEEARKRQRHAAAMVKKRKRNGEIPADS